MKKQLLLSLLTLSNLTIALEIPNLESLCDKHGQAFDVMSHDDPMTNYLLNTPFDQMEPTLIKWYTESPQLFTLSFHYSPNEADGDLLLESFYQNLITNITICTEQESDKSLYSKEKMLMIVLKAYEKTEHCRTSGAHQVLDQIRDVFIQKLMNHFQTQTYQDKCSVLLQAITHYCPEGHPDTYPDEIIKRYQEIVSVLQKLGLKKSLSDEQLDLFAQLQASDLFFPIKPIYIKERNMLIINAEMNPSAIEIIRIVKELIATYK